jgi:hypothetical protein
MLCIVFFLGVGEWPPLRAGQETPEARRGSQSEAERRSQ